MVLFHQEIRDRLKTQYLRGTVAQSYLFAGPRGIGKRTLAEWFARMLVCAAPQKDAPCGACHACRSVKTGTHPDVAIEAQDRTQTTIGIEELRIMRERLSRMPLSAQWSVTLVPDGERLSLAAQHAFLKTLEEPRSKSILILTATSSEILLPTILSRMTTVVFKHVPLSLLKCALKDADASVSGEAREELAAFSRGLPGRVLAGDSLREDARTKIARIAQVRKMERGAFWQVHATLKTMEKDGALSQEEFSYALQTILRTRMNARNRKEETALFSALARAHARHVNKDLAIDALGISLAHN